AGAAEDGADAGDDLFEAEGLGHIVIAADGQTGDLVRGVITRGEEDDGSVHADLAQAASDGEAVHVRQHHVEDEEVDVGMFGQAQGRGAVGGGDDGEGGGGATGGQERAAIVDTSY